MAAHAAWAVLNIGKEAANVQQLQQSRNPVQHCPCSQLKVPFLGAAVDASYFSSITTWKTDQISSYLRDKVLPRVATNLAFLGIALIALIVFLLW